MKRYYYIYGLCFGRVNAFKITNAYAIYKRYNPTRVLDPFAGFGGRMIGAMMANIKYRGYDLNKYMEASYAQLLDDFSSDGRTNVSISFCDSSLINYEEVARTYPYDMILTSPPYRNIELYRLSEKHSNDWWHDFYVRIFTSLWAGLATNGYMVVNINDEIYQESLVPFFGECREKVLLTKTKKNSYDEYIYTWIKC